MVRRLLCVLLVAAPLACSRTEVTGFSQGTDSTATSGTTGVRSSGSSAASTRGSSAGSTATSTTGTVSSTSGTTSTTGTVSSSTTGTTGAGGECASCSTVSDCQSGYNCNANFGVCLAQCDASGNCADPNQFCFTVSSTEQDCVPQNFCAGSSGSTGTIGTSTTGSSGSTGGCNLNQCFTDCFNQGLVCDTGTCTCQGGSSSGSSGTTGTTGGDCRTNGCPYGETCQQFGRMNSYYACACTTASRNSTDSCAGNPGGQDFCDAVTLQCRYGRDYDPCDPSVNVQQCASGFLCTPDDVCLQSCTVDSDCSASFTSCRMLGAIAVCQADTCGPGNFNGDYYQSCMVSSPNDGFCEPLPLPDAGIYGLCFRNGQLQTGDTCTGELYGAQCVAGDLCVPRNRALPDGGAAARCTETCNANNNTTQYNKSCTSAFSMCTPDSRAVSTDPDPGLCRP